MPLPAIPNRLLSSLDVLLLEASGNGAFRLVGEAPPWVQRLWPEAAGSRDNLRPQHAFLFLEHFLQEAEAAWNDERQEPVTSELWTEVDGSGTEWLLEAQALQVMGRPLLLIKFPTVAPEQLREVLQQSRELNLEHYRLLKEIDRREVMLHCIVHDLSTPLASIKGSLRTLQDERLVDEEGAPLLRIGLRQVEKMRAMVGEILRSAAPASAQAPRSDTHTTPDLGVALHELTTGLSPTATLKNVRFRLIADTRGQDAWSVVGESARLERVLFNLIENALRYAPPGTDVVIRLIDEGPTVLVSVEDAGEGVAPDDVHRLFRRYTQGSGLTGQVGLGLYFCRITIEGWGGSIGYEPSPLGGAAFWFRLPKPPTV